MTKGISLGTNEIVDSDESLDKTISNIMKSDFIKFDQCNVQFKEYGTMFCDTLAGVSSCQEKSKRICKSVCIALQSTYQKIGDANCEASMKAKDQANALGQYCGSLNETNCITFESNQFGNCGYVTVDDICQKCSTADQSLCSSRGYDGVFYTTNPTEKALAITGIVFGALVVFLVICSPLYLRWTKRKAVAKDDSRSFMSSTEASRLGLKRIPVEYDSHRLSGLFTNSRSSIWDDAK